MSLSYSEAANELEQANATIKQLHAELAALNKNYLAAINGRREFREMYRQKKKQADQYGLRLMMIREGCEDPKKFAAEILDKWKDKAS